MKITVVLLKNSRVDKLVFSTVIGGVLATTTHTNIDRKSATDGNLNFHQWQTYLSTSFATKFVAAINGKLAIDDSLKCHQ